MSRKSHTIYRSLCTGEARTTRQRGWGLTETLLTIGALSIMSLAIYAAFKPTDATAQVRIEQDNLRDISRNIDRSFGLLGSFEGLSTARVDIEGLAPARMKRAGNQLQTDWGTAISVQPYENPAKGITPKTAFSVTYPQTPGEVCAGLASAMARDAFDILVNGESVYDINGMSPTLAAQRCAAGNATMEIVFHSGLVAGQAVAAPPLVLPPAPPSTSPPPSTPPVMDIPDNPNVDDATPGDIPTPPPGSITPPPPPPLTAPSDPPPPAPIITTPPPPVPVTPPGSRCVVPTSWVNSEYHSPHCGAGQYGQRHQQRDQNVFYDCSSGNPGDLNYEEYSAWVDPSEYRTPFTSWYDTTNTCTACPTLTPEVETRWQTSTGSCPSGQAGTVSHEYEQSRSRTRTHVCPAGTLTLPGITNGTWSSWSNTGNTRNSVNTCEDLCVVPSPNPEVAREEGTPATQTLNCPPGQVGEIVQQRPRYRTRERTWSCPNLTGAPSATNWSTWSDWYQYGSWTTISNTCKTATCSGPTSETSWQPYENDCAAGQYGVIKRERERERTRTCNAGTWSDWSSWSNTGTTRLVSNTCTSCGTPSPQTRLDWQARSSNCPSGQTGSHTWEEQRNQSRTGTYNCPAGTRTLPSPTWSSTWTNGSWTGNRRNENNTCRPTVCTGKPVSLGGELLFSDNHGLKHEDRTDIMFRVLWPHGGYGTCGGLGHQEDAVAEGTFYWTANINGTSHSGAISCVRVAPEGVTTTSCSDTETSVIGGVRLQRNISISVQCEGSSYRVEAEASIIASPASGSFCP